jgi:hypothetical protein
MTRTPVSSSSIASVGHEGDVLEIKFRSGKVYRFSGVSSEQADALRAAPSVGKHFGAHIRGKFSHSVVEAAQVIAP